MAALARAAAPTRARRPVSFRRMRSSTLFRAGGRQQLGWGGQNDLDHLVARHVNRSPKQEVRPDQPHHGVLGPWRQRGRRVGERRRRQCPRVFIILRGVKCSGPDRFSSVFGRYDTRSSNHSFRNEAKFISPRTPRTGARRSRSRPLSSQRLSPPDSLL